MPAIESFDDVRRLTEPELRALLERGRPEERVWAIWALALRSSEPTIEAIAQRAEPAPGVRRNLAVVLAGHGHYDLLVALAKRDPAALVRAAAMQLVARIAIDGKLPEGLVRERVSAEVPEVKTAVLGTIVSGAPSWLVELAEVLLEDADAEVRYESFEALVRAGRGERARMWLEEAPEAETRIALVRWTARGNVRPAAETLASASRRLRRLLIECVRAASWHELAPVIDAEPMLVKALVGRAPIVLDQIPLATLVRVTLREPSDPWIHAIGSRLAALPSPDPDVSPWLPELVELCSRRISEIDRAVRETETRHVRDAYAEIDLQELGDTRVMHETTLEHAVRFIVH